MATARKTVTRKAAMEALKHLGAGGVGFMAGKVVSGIIDKKILKIDATSPKSKMVLSGIACAALGTLGYIKASTPMLKDFSLGFGAAGVHGSLRAAMPNLSLGGLDGGGYYDQYGNYVAGVNEVYNDEVGLAPISAATNTPANIDWRGEDYSFQPSLPMISGIQVPETSDGYYNDGTATVPALLGTDDAEIL